MNSEDALRVIAQAVKVCLLCGKKLKYIGMFYPDKPWDFHNAPPRAGMPRAICYGLCHKHFKKNDLAAVERALAENRQGQMPVVMRSDAAGGVRFDKE